MLRVLPAVYLYRSHPQWNRYGTTWHELKKHYRVNNEKHYFVVNWQWNHDPINRWFNQRPKSGNQYTRTIQGWQSTRSFHMQHGIIHITSEAGLDIAPNPKSAQSFHWINASDTQKMNTLPLLLEPDRDRHISRKEHQNLRTGQSTGGLH